MKFLSLNLVVAVFLITLISCTKEKKQVVNIKSFGEFKYVESESSDKSLLAEFAGIKITKDEVNKKSKVIQELNQQENSLYSALIYRMATNHLNKLVEDKTELKESYDLQVYTQEPKEGFESLANRIKLNLDDKIKVKFLNLKAINYEVFMLKCLFYPVFIYLYISVKRDFSIKTLLLSRFVFLIN